MESKTTIIIPALNEGPVIGGVVRRLLDCASLREAGITDIVVVDNGSDDDTAAQARAAGARVVSEPQRGYGRACHAGVLASPDAEIILQMDGDGSDLPDDIVRVWEWVRDGRADLAMGSRTQGGAERGALTPQQRAGNAVGAAILRSLYGLRLSDIGPLRAIRRDALEQMDMREMTYGWSAEMLAKAGRLGLRVAEVPVGYARRAGGQSKVAGTLSGTLRASWRILYTLGRYRRWVAPELLGDDGDRTRKARNSTKGSEGQGERQIRQALFIVARLPVVGQTKTRLGNVIGHAAATALYRAFLADIGRRFSTAAARDGYDLWWYYAAPAEASAADFAAEVPAGGRLLRQGEGDFGARLWAGFAALHEQGYERIVVLSSDSPHVPAAWVSKAFAALAADDVVIGPADDGGYYLLGQRGTPTDLFSGITMSTARVCAQTVALAQERGLDIAHLPTTFDIDEAADLASLRAALDAAPDLAPATRAALAALDAAPLSGGPHGER